MSRRVARFLLGLISLFATFLILDRVFPLDIDRLNKPKSRVVFDRFGKIIHISLSQDGFVRVPLQGEIPQNIKDALISYEDRFFYYHFGVNPISILRALIFDLTHSRKIGASTITMQVARLMHHRKRTVLSKIKEIFEAIQLEWHYSKDEILRFYLNNTPYGGNIEGIEGASILYFGLSCNLLSTAQSAYLVSIPKNPNRNRPRNSKRVEYLKLRVLNSMVESGRLKPDSAPFRERLSPKRASLPNFIPTFALRFPKRVVRSSINLKLQKMLKKSLKSGLKRVKKLNIFNASGLIIDNRKREVLAYVGSATFEQNSHSSRVDGIEAVISAGSTLKPFVYAKAFELGLLTPNRRVFDIPYSVGDFMPQNYENRFFGELKAKEALYLSRNIPALQINRILKQNSLYEILKMAKIPTIKKAKSYYGSSIVLGGSGIRLIDIAKLYLALANGGVFGEITFELGDKKPKNRVRLLSKEASWLTLNILTETPRGRFDSSWEFIKGRKKVAFKTGTSAHAFDMLSIGITSEFTVAVWLGDLSRKFGVGSRDRERNGFKVAMPVMMDIFKQLKSKGWFEKPEKIVKREICEDAIIINRCRIREVDETIKGVRISRACEYFTPQILTRLIKKGEISNFYDLKNHRCFQFWREYKPLIEGLGDGKTYIKNRLLPQSMRLTPLKCYSFDRNSTVFWFIDDEQPVTAESGEEIFRYIPAGRHTIRCLDTKSKERKIEIEIKEL